MNKNIKQFIISTIQERDQTLYQTLLRQWRLGYTKKPIRPNTLIIFPSKSREHMPYKHSLNQEVLGVFREEGNQVRAIYLDPYYTTAAVING